ncbi:MAG: HlyD family efflux transporter periplasmic adaptor subunit [Pseudomonadota bacterium]
MADAGDGANTDIILPHDLIDHDADSEAKRERGVRVRWYYLVPLLLLIPLGGILGMYFQPAGLQRFFEVTGLQPGAGSDDPIAIPSRLPVAETDAALPSPRDVVALGRLLPSGSLRTLAPPFGSADASIKALMVSEGDTVDAGSILAVLTNEDTLLDAANTARADVRVKTAALAQTRNSVEASLQENRAAVQKAQSAVEIAQGDFDRFATLLERGTVTRAAVDQRRSTLEQAQQEVRTAEARLSRFDGEPEQQVDVVLARETLQASVAQVERAERELENAYVRAPIDGTILKIHARPGEKPGSAGIMDIGDTTRMTVEIEVFQTDVQRVALGQPVNLTAQAFDATLSGEVTRIGLEVGSQTMIGDDPAANTDARVVTVTAQLDDPSSEIAARFVNLEVVARIDTGTPETN